MRLGDEVPYYHKELRPFVRRLEASGGRVEVSSGGHLRFYNRNGVLIGTESSTPGRPGRARHRVRMMLRRAGIE